jgi:hypothetical protein
MLADRFRCSQGEGSMQKLIRALLILALAALGSSPALANLITLGYYGVVLDSSGYPGLAPGDPISIVVTYDPASPPPDATVDSDPTRRAISVENGAINGLAWANWMTLTATFGTYSFANDLPPDYLNFSANDVADGRSAPGNTFEDDYEPFVVSQQNADASLDRSIYWYIISASGIGNPDLTNGLAIPQVIDLSSGSQTGYLTTTDPIDGSDGTVTRFVDFELSRIDVPLGTVPEPTTPLLLVAASLAALGSLRIRRH